MIKRAPAPRPVSSSIAAPLSLMVGVDCRVEDERVRLAVPASVYEADQRVTVERTDPRQAVALQPLRPRLRRRHRVAERAAVQIGQHLIVDGEADAHIHYLATPVTAPSSSVV